ncbi:hypothetical protein F4801DRAFT_580635 [Xylaria longipes]|nr:hypothetical protein F4801DRAFT_580635 [Xylaria longipes]
MHSFTIVLFQVFLISTNALPQAGTTTCFPTMWASDTSSTITSTLLAETTSTVPVELRVTPEPGPMKTLSVCCCCLVSALDELQPAVYLGECSRTGTLDVCGNNYTGISGYTMEGLEGHPEQIIAVCSISRCGAMRYVD